MAEKLAVVFVGSPDLSASNNRTRLVPRRYLTGPSAGKLRKAIANATKFLIARN